MEATRQEPVKRDGTHVRVRLHPLDELGPQEVRPENPDNA